MIRELTILYHCERDMIANSNDKQETLGRESMRLEISHWKFRISKRKACFSFIHTSALIRISANIFVQSCNATFFILDHKTNTDQSIANICCRQLCYVKLSFMLLRLEQFPILLFPIELYIGRANRYLIS